VESITRNQRRNFLWNLRKGKDKKAGVEEKDSYRWKKEGMLL